jgi:hypothetical protein
MAIAFVDGIAKSLTLVHELRRSCAPSRNSPPSLASSKMPCREIAEFVPVHDVLSGAKPVCSQRPPPGAAVNCVLTLLDAGRSWRVRLRLTQQVPQKLLPASLAHLLECKPRLAVMTREGTTDELLEGL